MSSRLPADGHPRFGVTELGDNDLGIAEEDLSLQPRGPLPAPRPSRTGRDRWPRGTPTGHRPGREPVEIAADIGRESVDRFDDSTGRSESDSGLIGHP